MESNQTIQSNRARAIAALGRKIDELPPDKYRELDARLDELCRKTYNLPERPLGKDPYGWLPPVPDLVNLDLSNNLSDKSKLTGQDVRAIPQNIVIPEFQLNRSNYLSFTSMVLGTITVTGGFMEAEGHSQKPKASCLWACGKQDELPPSNRNLGIDYVPAGGAIRSWYSGTVIAVGSEKGYGLRCHIRYDTPFIANKGKTVATAIGAYAHAKEFYVKTGDRVQQGQAIGEMGSSGGNYPPHVDYRLTTQLGSKIIDISPNYYDKMFPEQQKQ